jgi:fibronectin-binding autotransporter adhesin
MSDPTFNTPIYRRQGGSVQTVDSSGTIQVLSGGQITVAAGGSFVNGGAQSFSGVQTIASGGTLLVASGGSVQVASGGAADVAGLLSVPSGGSITVASGGSIQNAGVNAVLSGGKVNVLSGGSILVASGGSAQVASGGQIHVAAATGLSAPAGMLMNGTVMKWAMGTLTLTSGVGTLGVVGFTRVMAATANNILGEASGNGSATSVHVDLSLSGAGSVIFRAIAGTLGYAANQVIAYQAIGT